jgi:hypothetical protein
VSADIRKLFSRLQTAAVSLPVSLSARHARFGFSLWIDWIRVDQRRGRTRVEGVEQEQNATPLPAYSVADSVLRAFASIRYRLGCPGSRCTARRGVRFA